MRQVRPDLCETESFSPFEGLTTHAYLLTRPDGNVLFYNTGHVEELGESLRILCTLKPDLVFGSAFTGDEGFEDVSNGSWPEKVDEALQRLEGG